MSIEKVIAEFEHPKTGGPAFPVQYDEAARSVVDAFGMTLRDYFAARVMAGLLANPNFVVHSPMSGWTYYNSDVPSLAEFCYVQADAMLAERAK